MNKKEQEQLVNEIMSNGTCLMNTRRYEEEKLSTRNHRFRVTGKAFDNKRYSLIFNSICHFVLPKIKIMPENTKTDLDDRMFELDKLSYFQKVKLSIKARKLYDKQTNEYRQEVKEEFHKLLRDSLRSKRD
jgi:hypothetical protein